jgi:hypothetical protein
MYRLRDAAIHVDLDQAEPGDPGGVRFKSEVAVVDQGPG